MYSYRKSVICRKTLGEEDKNSSSLYFNKRIAFSLSQMLVVWVGIGLFAISLATTAGATPAMPTCAELGYNNNEYYCASTSHSNARLRCPWNTHWMACDHSGTPSSTSGFVVDCDNRDCATLGYTRTAAQCANYYALKCPFDNTKFFCGGSGCIDDGYTTNPTCPSGQEVASTHICPNDSSLKKVTCQPTCASQGYTMDESTCKTNYQMCEKCPTGDEYKGSGTYYSTKTCAKGDILFSNKKCYANDTAPTAYQTKIAVVFSLASDAPGKLAMALNETSTTVSPVSNGAASRKHFEYNTDSAVKADIFNSKTYTCPSSGSCNQSTATFRYGDAANIRSMNSNTIYACPNGGVVPTVSDWYYYKSNQQSDSKYTSNGGTVPGLSTKYWVSNGGGRVNMSGSNDYHYAYNCNYIVKPSVITSTSPYVDVCCANRSSTTNVASSCGGGCPNNSYAYCAKVRCVYTF